ncbi:MAG: BrnT family toxin [Pseudomonadota bacterium]
MGPTVERRERYGLFEWDSDKAASNEQKHGIRFEDACGVFTGPFHVMEEASDKNEERVGIIGHAQSINPDHPLYVVAEDLGENHWRIISVRLATKQERRRYEEEAY